MPFTLLEYAVRLANNIRSKFSEIAITTIQIYPKMAQECTPEVNSRQMKFLTALREKGHSSIDLAFSLRARLVQERFLVCFFYYYTVQPLVAR